MFFIYFWHIARALLALGGRGRWVWGDERGLGGTSVGGFYQYYAYIGMGTNNEYIFIGNYRNQFEFYWLFIHI